MSKELKIADLVDKVQSYYPAADVDLIRKAYDFSAKVHQGQKRLSGEPYLIHPMAVAGVIADLKMDVPSVIGGLLHDTVEDTLTTLEELKGIFGREIAVISGRRYQTQPDEFQQPGRKTGGKFSQDAVGHGERREGDSHQARGPGSQHAHARSFASRKTDSDGPRNAGYLCAHGASLGGGLDQNRT